MNKWFEVETIILLTIFDIGLLVWAVNFMAPNIRTYRRRHRLDKNLEIYNQMPDGAEGKRELLRKIEEDTFILHQKGAW